MVAIALKGKPVDLLPLIIHYLNGETISFAIELKVFPTNGCFNKRRQMFIKDLFTSNGLTLIIACSVKEKSIKIILMGPTLRKRNQISIQTTYIIYFHILLYLIQYEMHP